MRRRERLLGEVDAVIPWAGVFRMIEPHSPSDGNGAQPMLMPMPTMLRIYFALTNRSLVRR